MSTLEEVIREWQESKEFGPYFTACTTVLPKEAQFLPIPGWLDERLKRGLEKTGITQLYSHQAKAIEAIREGRNVVVVTPTASGKTLCYNLPVLNGILSDPTARSLFVFPTKALTQDQYSQLHELINDMRVDVATHTYDGDTPGDARSAIREHGHIVLTNPDMLHSAILPHHPKWMKLFRNLKYVVIDEVHTYRGVFGSHMANVIRRLKRIARFHGSDPVFICCSATIGNPKELVERLLETSVECIDQSGAPSGLRHVLIYNPPVINSQLGLRANYLKQARRFALRLVEKGIANIVFALSRLNVELLVKYLREDLAKLKVNPQLVQGYRGGYLPIRRREIERGLRSGEVKCVVATNALELGIDIGSLDAAIVAGYPGTQASLLQQWGRAGRKSGHSLAVLVGKSSPVDQYVVTNPDYLLGRSPEMALIDPDNPYILADHLKCASFELPFSSSDCFGRIPAESVREMFDTMQEAHLVRRVRNRVFWSSDAFPASAISLRNIPGENFVVIDRNKGKVIAEVDFVSAHTMLHEGAIHNVDGVQYHVKQLDYSGRKAYVEEAVTDFFTEAEKYLEVRVLRTESTREEDGLVMSHGEVSVTEKVVGYKKIRFDTNENVGYGQVNLPELTVHTMACWVSLRPEVLKSLPYGKVELADAIVAVARTLHHVAAFKLMCSTEDLGHCVGDQSAGWFSVGGVTTRGHYNYAQSHPNGFSPTIFLFDRRAGGVGLAPGAFSILPDLLAASRRLISLCPCSNGCPSCIGPSPASVLYNPKQVSLALLDRLVIPDGRYA